MTAAKKQQQVVKKRYVPKVENPPSAMEVEAGIIDDQISRIYSLLQNNHERILDLHDKLGGPYPRGDEGIPDDIDNVIPSVLDFITSQLCNQQENIERIHECLGNKLGRIRLY